MGARPRTLIVIVVMLEHQEASMRVRLALSLALLAAVGSSGFAAQARPNFTGNWTNADPNATRSSNGIMYLGSAFTAQQDDRTLTVTPTKHLVHVGEWPELMKAVFNLDGSESKNPLTSGGRPLNRYARATWDRDMLVITTTTSDDYNVSTQTQTWSLNRSGELVVDAVLTYRGNSTTSRATYRKR